MAKIINEDVSSLNLPKKLIGQLKENNINTVEELCNHSKMELVELGFQNGDVNDIAICLQLVGVDLKKNHAKRNKIIDKARSKI